MLTSPSASGETCLAKQLNPNRNHETNHNHTTPCPQISHRLPGHRRRDGLHQRHHRTKLNVRLARPKRQRSSGLLQLHASGNLRGRNAPNRRQGVGGLFCRMKPDLHFRYSGRPPCTANATNASGSVLKPLDFNAVPLASVSTAPEAETRESPKSGATSLSTNDCLSPNWKDITKEPNACTADATDASASEEPLTSSGRATGDGSHAMPTSPPLPTHGETTSHGAASLPHRRRGRPRKSP